MAGRVTVHVVPDLVPEIRVRLRRIQVAVDRLVADVVSPASLAAVDRQSITLAFTASGPIPDLQPYTVAIGRPTIGEEQLAARSVGLGKNQVGSRHWLSTLAWVARHGELAEDGPAGRSW